MFKLTQRVRKHLKCGCWMPGILRRILTGASASHKNFEVERKYSTTSAERDNLPGKLLSMGFRCAGQAYMKDVFVPAETEGDMIRVREETMNDRTKILLTLKTWEQVEGGRERREDEEEVSSLVRNTLLEVGTRLAGGKLLTFSKERDLYTRTQDGRKVTVSLDTVEGLGEYSGLYMEIEFLVQRKCDVKAAREAIQVLVTELLGEGRQQVEMSYMDMLKRASGQES
ncbi:MAG: CYTH domain-containing protein [Terriglobales bacterium]